MGRNWTPGQRDAIEARGGTLLVSAAAGSGKTAVLVQRVIERLTDERHPTDADRLLVVTFTKAAAAEMRDRIAAQIALLLEEDPYNVRLQRQQILLARAQISTIHSFCSELVRENFYKLGVSPDFRILDDAEMTLLRNDAMAQVLDEYYALSDRRFWSWWTPFPLGATMRGLSQQWRPSMNLCVPTRSRSGGCAKRPPSIGRRFPHPRPSGGRRRSAMRRTRWRTLSP